MVEIQAGFFLALMRNLSVVQVQCLRILDNRGNIPFPVEVKDGLRVNLAAAVDNASLLGLNVATEWAKRLVELLSEEINVSDVQRKLEQIVDAVETDLHNKLFMYLPADKLPYYHEAALFGDDVETKLPTVSGDIAEAGRCFALGRHTATVFHLMRVLEAAVQEFGRSLGITINPRDMWDTILRQVQAAIPAMPHGARRAACEGLYAALNAVRIAWRNPTMHGVDRTYTEEEAEQIWNCTRAFLVQLAALL
jgi:hypothetical protein